MSAQQNLSTNTDSLRRITSNPTLLPPSSPSRATTQTLHSSRPGSKSPTSIPSSPTSIRSSSSAIFERDIEPLLPTYSHPLSPNPHRTPRSRATEQIEQSVPSVLDEAANALASDIDISIIAPVVTHVPFDLSSRSPSPTRRQQPQLLPTHSPIPSPPTTSSPLPATSSPVPSTPDPPSTLHATPTAASKRLSFISYTDMISSAPLTSTPLSTFTSPPTSFPPPHIPAVSSSSASVSSPSIRSVRGNPSSSRPLSTYSIAEELKDDIGGEWEREGFGKGLEERLEGVMVASPSVKG